MFVASDRPAARQAPAPIQRFEVASIRPTTVIFTTARIMPGGRYGGHSDLRSLVHFAYGLAHHEQVEAAGRVSGLLAQRFEINAKAPGDASPVDRGAIQTMLRQLLEERLGIKAVFETTEQDIWVLRPITGERRAPGLEPFNDTCINTGGARPGATFDAAYAKNCGVIILGNRAGGTGTMEDFARLFGVIAHRPIMDGTGSPERFRFDFTFDLGTLAPELGSRGDAPSFADALRDRLGLAIRTERQPVRKLVVEYVGELMPD